MAGPSELAAMPKKFSSKTVDDLLSFLKDVQARFASDSSVSQEFFDLLPRFGRGEITDGPAITARVEAILRDHPDLVARFHAFVPVSRKVTIKLPGEDATMAQQRCRTQNQCPAAAAVDPDYGKVSCFLERVERGTQNQRPAAATVDPGYSKASRFLERVECGTQNQRPAAAAVDPGYAKASRFLERVERAGSRLYNGVLALMLSVKEEPTMDAHEIYSRAERVFGSANRDLLREFTEFLPTERDLPRYSQPEERRPARKRKALTVTVATDTGKTANRPKRPHGGWTEGAHRDTNVSEFRHMWKFETLYSKLVATMTRTKKLLRAYEDKKDPDTDDSPDLHGRWRVFRDIFPGRETREVLEGLYGSHWGPMQAALEDINHRRRALEVISVRLRQQEDIAVRVAMERRDVTRVASRLSELVIEVVTPLRKDRG